MRSRFVRAVILLCVAIAAVACSKSLKIDQLETQLGEQLNTQLKTKGITVDCPNDIKAESGGEFDCTGTVPSSGTVTIHVTQTDDTGHVTWEVTGVATGPTGPSGATASGPSGST